MHIVGRYDGCDPGGTRTAWSGSGFVARIDAEGLAATLSGPSVQYTVVVDAELQPDLVTHAGENRYQLVSGLSRGEHTVELYRRGEASFGPVVLKDVHAVGGALLAPPVAPARRIEVVGDSISAGYGDQGESPNCSFSADTEDHYLSYGAVLARSLHAELSTVAWSGKGVAVNYGGDHSTTLPQMYERVIPTEEDSQWTFSWQPQVVLINLGTNDYSTDNDPNNHEFVGAYVGLLETIREHYAHAFILCTVGPTLAGSDLAAARDNIAEAVEQRIHSGDNAVSVYELQTGNPNPGCDWHPGIATHAAMAAELEHPIRAALGW